MMRALCTLGAASASMSTPARLAPAARPATQMAADSKKILVLGGDGFCGWPTAVHLSDKGHQVTIVDNLSRRDIDTELGCDSLTPIQHPEVRIAAWKEIT